MGIDVTDCKQLWASIRTRYVRERRLIKNIPSGFGAYTCKWPLFQHCGFLDTVIKPRRTLSNIINNSPGCSEELWQDAILRDDGSLEIESESIQEGTEVDESCDEVDFREEENGENEHPYHQGR
ncbi:hypothetical protein JTB14_025522 [Gonioctena quinquepunctata]|nr:hypothetical protein JTB14_025522 [Gonioctena quinquepunctata]